MKDAFFVVWNPLRGNPMHRHDDQLSAQREAERLARQQPDDEFYVLRALTVSKFNAVHTEALDEPLIF